MTTDVLLVNPTRVGEDSYCTPPLHLLYLKRALNDNGFSVHLVNAHERFCRAIDERGNYDVNAAAKRTVENEAIAEILDCDARLVGIGGVCPSYEFAEKLVCEIKSRKNTPVAVGGSLGLPLKDLWFKHTEADFLCEADGERVIVEIMRCINDPEKLKAIPGLHHRADGAWHGVPPELPRDLDYIKAPDIRDIDYEFYMGVLKRWVNVTLPKELRLKAEDRIWPVVLTRGCVYNCLFCFHFNRRHRRHSIDYIINHLSRLKEEFGVTAVMTWDDLIMADPKWFMELCDALAASSLGIKIFTSGGKADLLNEEMVRKMVGAGFFRMSFGIESGSQAILDEMQKRTTVADNRKAIDLVSAADIFVHINIVLGMPSETRATLKETQDFLLDAVETNGLSVHNVSCAFATGYPGTQLFDRMLKGGLVNDVRDYILNVKGVGVPEPSLCALSEAELGYFHTKLCRSINDLCYARSGQHLKRLLNCLAYNRLTYTASRLIPRQLKAAVRSMLE